MKSPTTIDRARQSYATHALSNDASNIGRSKHSGTKWVATEDVEYDKLRRCIGSSFAGTDAVDGEPMAEWCTSHMFETDNAKSRTTGENTHPAYTYEDHREVMSFGVGFHIWDALRNKHDTLVVARQSKDHCDNDDGDKKYACAAIVQEFDPKLSDSWWRKLCSGFRFVQAFFKMMETSKVPAFFKEKQYKQDRKYFEKKAGGVFGSLKEDHKHRGPQQVHWYVFMVGVSPDYNGQGYGRLLMEELNRLADEQNVVQYLECGSSKEGFYEKMGYKVIERKQFVDPVDPKMEPPLDACFMVRHPN
mmetsp:Transcript_48531/g.117402  ORF Transcript_48531/g.117402 Transcript_48531/m.117402 type:complete len:304 (+) Transcript_48531:209-1120(+)|eukprot:CAMPEP_0113508406 /NCGR_PEP_ID=MMETSP0014_2-20120614/37000_1 /TAXON_ID=2857 /ORGANISM="Nitzschia sp." /LENGTH=303 /DNA_ID=CAMNT_0000404117 /DNA_START=195 /DNA_END=1106 /DNA_ORIENTATION=- /assembly_acc=CAM_ASM_000159